MAYDKVVDSSFLDAGLKQIADAIREKGGTSDNLAFPTAMAEAIAAIEAGGGFAFGTHTPVSTQSSRRTIEHGLGRFPNGIVFAKRNRIVANDDTILFNWMTNGSLVRFYKSGGALYSPSLPTTNDSLTAIKTENHSNTDIVCGVTENTFKTPVNLCTGPYLWVVW